jgi:predicted RNase H-like HicB family nuclease
MVLCMEKKVYNFTVLIEKDEEGWFVAKVPDLQGCATQGKTVEEALERVKEAIQVCVEAEKEAPEQLKFVGVQQVEVKV